MTIQQANKTFSDLIDFYKSEITKTSGKYADKKGHYGMETLSRKLGKDRNYLYRERGRTDDLAIVSLKKIVDSLQTLEENHEKNNQTTRTRT